MIVDRRQIVLAALASLVVLAPNSAKARFGPVTRMIRRKNRLFIPAQINGHRVQALLDSAAELTLLDRSFARRIGLLGGTEVEAKGSGARTVAAQLLDNVTMAAPGMVARKGPAAVVDLTDVSRRLNGAPIFVILGRDYFDQARLEIDIRAQTLRPLAPSEQAKGRLFPLKTEFGVETMTVVVEGLKVQATVDLGNGNDPLISPALAARIGALTDGRAVGEARGGGIGGEASRKRSILKSMAIGGKTFVDVPIVIDAGENATDLNLGTSILSHFILTTDFSNHRLWLRSR
jgi:predicted aspartyl protease